MVDSVERVSRALATLAAEPGGLSVVDFSRKMQTSKASGSRLLSMLGDAGLAERDPVTQQYFLGIRVFTFGAAALNSLHPIEFALVPMVQTAKSLGIPVSLNVQRGDTVITILRVELLNDHDVFVRPVGSQTLLSASATGKIIAAFCDGDESPVRGKEVVNTDGSDPQQIRAAGYARRDFDWGFSVAVPIFNHTKRPIATIAAVWRSDHPADVSEARIAGELKQLCRNLSRLLGYVSSADAAFA